VSHRDPIADPAGKFVGQMDHRIVLNVGVMPNHDPLDVPAQDGIIPDAGMVTERHIPENHGCLCNVDPLAQHRLLAQVRI